MHLLTQRIDLDAIAANTALVKKLIGDRKLMAVVKADGYNHGAVVCAHVMAAHGADQFGVATLKEAVTLRESGITKPILAWMWRPEQDIAAALQAGIDLAIISAAHAHAVVRAAKETEITAQVTVKVETGMGRSGVCEADWPSVFRTLAEASRYVQFTGIMSHLALGDEEQNPYNNAQAATFRRAVAAARAAGLTPQMNHLANSPTTLARHDLGFDMVRPGIALYGVEPVAGEDHGLQPAMTLLAKVVVVKPIAQGQPVSYGGTWRAPSDGFIATIPFGYADGCPRSWQNHLWVTIDGERYPQVGRVCMDQIIIFLGDNQHGVRGGDDALIFGPGTHQEMTAEELALATDTIAYEIVCAPHGRIHREYVSPSGKNLPAVLTRTAGALTGTFPD
ncbi:alanine racemase [Corynebacterium choanae]|nr:alanine racemase [Corynebacterium choanae]